MSVPWGVGYITRRRAELHPDKTAVVCEGEHVSYQQLNDGVNRCAHMLQSRGLKKGDRVAVLLLNCMEFLETFFAAAKLGLTFVPLSWRMVPRELQYQLNDCSVSLLLFHDQFIGNVDQIRNQTKVKEDQFIYLQSDQPGQPEKPDWAVDYRELVKGQSTSEPMPDAPVMMDDPLAILYTSGTTGDPKGAVLTHEQTYFKNYQVSLYAGLTPDDVMIAQMPLFHSGGLFIVASPALNAGMTMVMRRGFNPDEFAEDIQTYKATIVFALTTMWKLILATGKLDQIDASSVRAVIGGGERTPPSLFEELAKRGLYMQQGFGQTENSAMMLLPKEDIFRKMGSVGKPGFFTDIWIADMDGNRLKPNEIGEIVASGPTVMSGYWNMPQATQEAIVDGVLHTGDLGYMDDEGFFYIVDRVKDMYRSGGENVYPAEVEKILCGHPNIANAAIIGVPDDRWGETGMAFILPNPGETVAAEDVLEFLKGKVSKFKYPTHVKIVEELPLTSTTKVRKSELRAQYAQGVT
ncbi:MAG: long-chain fatty acid--CoA ligase [Chloroflexota bacterium]|nr:long-chain fatty acid--CoA ligase [Chloroflexota bacterium]